MQCRAILPLPRVPSYRRHKPSGQAAVTLNGCDIYLGKAKAEIARLRDEEGL